MNIFVVDLNPRQAARDLADKHVVKMVLEGCQMLSTNHRMAGSHVVYTSPVEFYKQSFQNHPCTIWARQNKENYMWLAEHTHELSLEYTRRYNKIHKAHDMTVWFTKYYPLRTPEGELTPFAQAMPDKYRCNDAVTAYRNYYIGEKAKFAKWKLGNIPDWFIQGVNANANVSVPVLQS